ncbi:hypothetical protein [Helicobacter labacensis]|uniref:hypothetical protein n=1 Tax=Helicobacter labacensis TaxID=2316079 RepID=UPI000EB0AA21|nr:hypothetical protein [Helicobacter labacensis]
MAFYIHFDKDKIIYKFGSITKMAKAYGYNARTLRYRYGNRHMPIGHFQDSIEPLKNMARDGYISFSHKAPTS